MNGFIGKTIFRLAVNELSMKHLITTSIAFDPVIFFLLRRLHSLRLGVMHCSLSIVTLLTYIIMY